MAGPSMKWPQGDKLKLLHLYTDPRAGLGRWKLAIGVLFSYLLPLSGILWLLVTQLLLSSLLFLIILAIHRPRLSWRRGFLCLLLWGLFFASSIAPFDITFINYPGPPRFVRLIAGRPTLQGYLLLMQHEAVLTGCMRHGNEPKWVWIW